MVPQPQRIGTLSTLVAPYVFPTVLVAIRSHLVLHLEDAIPLLPSLSRRQREVLIAQLVQHSLDHIMLTLVTLAAEMPCTREMLLTQCATLTKREEEILRYLLAGLPGTAIATRLVLSKRTVYKHMENIYLKLDVHSSGEAVAWIRALERGSEALF